ncbi:hypothetical protein [Falsiroseomonas sp. CW058]|uniref:hypothetical protein n=1 Tax=Falsiroseomonas sp. CW058 TaxID=3388664 RepID=UPI003D31AE36
MSDPQHPAAPVADPPAPTLEGVVAALRRLAITALDAGHPMAAAQIAGTADRVEAEAWPPLPARPDYRAPPRR